MPAPMDDNDLRKYIEAFADGELDVETNLRVLERMAMNPQATQRVIHQQELRKLVDRAMREQTPPVSADLRARIEALAASPSLQSSSGSASPANRSAVLARIGRWAPAVAATLLLAVGIYLLLINRPVTQPVNPPIVDAATPFSVPIHRTDLVESRRATSMGKRHENCSAKIENLAKLEQFGRDLSLVPARIADYLGPQLAVPIPDLSALGYEFSGAGACGLPGGKAVHLVYKPIDSTGREDSVSLWIRGDQARQVNVAEGHLYSATPVGSPHPILVWRRGDAVYYLVGDTSTRMTDAAVTLYAGR